MEGIPPHDGWYIERRCLPVQDIGTETYNVTEIFIPSPINAVKHPIDLLRKRGAGIVFMAIECWEVLELKKGHLL